MSASTALQPVEPSAPAARSAVRTAKPAGREHESWGRFPRASHAGVVEVEWSCAPPELGALGGPVLPYGLGRSYGDVCLNDGGILIDTRRMSRLVGFDRETGLLHCEAGMSLAAILEVVIPHGWFLPVTPGTKHVTVGGAIANDVHGKNHHRAGTLGRHLLGFDLLRSSGERLWCSPTANRELFCATIGGLGLTGLILTAALQLRRVSSPHIAVERIRYGGLQEFLALDEEADASHEYTVAWVDAFARGRALGRGIFMRGNHADPRDAAGIRPPRRAISVPLEAPGFLLAAPTMRLANSLY
jgi:FAD/FMN-containing dehydrogenase